MDHVIVIVKNDKISKSYIHIYIYIYNDMFTGIYQKFQLFLKFQKISTFRI